MSARSLFIQSVTLAFAVSLSGLAAARKPAVLERFEASQSPNAPSTSGYRDMLARFRAARAEATSSALLRSGGYRDMLVRFETVPAPTVRTASNERSSHRH